MGRSEKRKVDEGFIVFRGDMSERIHEGGLVSVWRLSQLFRSGVCCMWNVEYEEIVGVTHEFMTGGCG
jgi:hypothetical protein